MMMFMKTILLNEISLNSDKITLLVLDHAYLEEIMIYCNDNKEFHHLALPTLPINYYTSEFQSEKLWIEYDKMIKNEAIRFYIFEKSDLNFSNIVGDIAVFNISDFEESECEIGFKLNKSYSKLGIMSEALKLVLNYLKKDLNLKIVNAYCLPHNSVAINLLEKLSFNKESLVQNFMSHESVLKDYVKMVLINKENYE